MVFRFFADYLTHRLVAKNRHGTHSPFVYKLADEVIYDFSAKKIYTDIEEQRKKLLNDDNLLLSIPNGESGIPLQSSKIRIRDLAKRWMKSPKLDQLIYRLVVNRQPSTVLQIGSGFGISTCYLSSAIPNALITVIDDLEIASPIKTAISALQLKNVDLILGNPQQLLQTVLSSVKILDLVHLNHIDNGKRMCDFFELCLPKATENSIFIIDGIYANKEMKAAWADIKHNPKVTVTIDLFWLGLVYLKKDQVEEHFKIKF